MDPLLQVFGNTSQREPAFARTDQVKNAAGGYVFEVTWKQRVLRFLILGTDGGTYYHSEKELTLENARFIWDLANDQDDSIGWRLVALIEEVSMAGRAPKQNATLFALALASASTNYKTRDHAYWAMGRVCRTHDMRTKFLEYRKSTGVGWSRGFRQAVARWYIEPAVNQVAYQAVKYRQRNGYTHRDVLRLAHPVARSGPRSDLFGWITRGTLPEHLEEIEELSNVEGYLRAQAATTPREWARIVDAYKLPWECLPDAAMNEPLVWESMLPHTGLTALIRHLPRLTRIGLLKPLSGDLKVVLDRLTDHEDLVRSRVHPFNVLNALATYKSGKSLKGSSTWQPVSQVVDALSDAFYEAFPNITPAGKRTMIAVDGSGSMMGNGSSIFRGAYNRWSHGGYDNLPDSSLTPFEGAAAMAMVTARTEPQYVVTVFSTGLKYAPISPKHRLDDVVKTFQQYGGGGTDAAQPMIFAQKNRLEVDTFLLLTDNETWAGNQHPFQALRAYREATGIPAKMVIVGMTATDHTIADRGDPGMLDVVGMDSATPDLISGFSRGDY